MLNGVVEESGALCHSSAIPNVDICNACKLNTEQNRPRYVALKTTGIFSESNYLSFLVRPKLLCRIVSMAKPMSFFHCSTNPANYSQRRFPPSIIPHFHHCIGWSCIFRPHIINHCNAVWCRIFQRPALSGLVFSVATLQEERRAVVSKVVAVNEWPSCLAGKCPRRPRVTSRS